MKTSLGTLIVMVLIYLLHPAPSLAATANALPEDEGSTPSNLIPQQHWPSPVDDMERFTFILADVLEYRPKGDHSDFRWDIEGWHGGDYKRIWFKSEGERNTAFKADYDIDFQLLYGRFFRKYYDFQAGLRSETQTFGGQNVTRVQAVVGVEGLAPYRYEVESALFISHRGDLSVRFTITKNFLLTQRVVFQPRLESHAAVQRVARFTTGRGLNNIEFGLRLRYEIRRELAPYIGVSFDRSFSGTADLVRQEGGDPRQVRFAAGVRMWF
ncbi:MAG: copper resistance protein B [Candidatus Manganitrophus sp. SB1]|nr:copper resistance protein B [Candidatus Manganitrophus morganii]